MPAAPFAALCLLASPWTPAPVDVFLSVATFLTCMSQQFHAWAHMKKSELPAVVDRLQVQQRPHAQELADVSCKAKRQTDDSSVACEAAPTVKSERTRSSASCTPVWTPRYSAGISDSGAGMTCQGAKQMSRL